MIRKLLAAAIATVWLLGIGGAAAAATPPAWPVATHLRISAPSSVELGRMVQVVARLTDAHGLPVSGAEITFQSTSSWGSTASGTMIVGQAVTDGEGNAVLTVPFRRTGHLPVTAVFAGDVRHLASKASTTVTVSGTEQQVQPQVGARIPGVGIWVLGLVLVLVWGTYLAAGARAVRIASLGDTAAVVLAPPQGDGSPTRRDFLSRAFPFAIEGTLAVLGGGLLAILARSPKTHTNQAEDVPATYNRTPVAYVGKDTPATPIPAPLAREVSFSNDVLPILISRAGPHVDLPVNSPPPGGMRLDTYKHLKMMSPGEGLEVIVPGKPEESLLIQVLTDPGKRMPPVGMPLPQEELQIISSWIAQGAKDN